MILIHNASNISTGLNVINKLSQFSIIYNAVAFLSNSISSTFLLPGIIVEQSGLFEELKLLKAHADSQLREEKSKSSTLLQGLEGAPLKTELSLLKDNQQLVLQLQQTEEKVKVCLLYFLMIGVIN